MNSEVNITSCFGGIFPMFIIILLEFVGSLQTKIAAFPDEILSEYFSSGFDCFITFEVTEIVSPILAENDEKRRSGFLLTYILNSRGFFWNF